jgi:hypothetical protein
MVNFLWFGGFVLVFGAGLCVFPDARERKRLEASMAIDDREAA